MENTLQHCLTLIGFFSSSSKEFSQKVGPYKKWLKRQLYKNLINSYLDSDSKPMITFYFLERLELMEFLKFSHLRILKLFITLGNGKSNTITIVSFGGSNPLEW